MSLSNKKNFEEGTIIRAKTSEKWGTIFTTAGEKHIVPISDEEAAAMEKQFNEKDYLEKIKIKATNLATKIMADARKEASVEVEKLITEGKAKTSNITEEAYASAYDKGYTEGFEKGSTAGHNEAYGKAMDEAKDELDALRSGMADSVSAVLSTIEGQCSHIFDQWKADLIAVSRLAAEHIATTELSEKKAEVLSNLLTEAVATLDEAKRLVIQVNPEDESTIADIISTTREKYPDIATWEVRADATISPGGLMLEAESSLAESLVEARKAAVTKIFSQLGLAEK